MLIDDSSMTRQSLLRRAREQHSQAWHELVELYSPLVRSWCRGRGLSDHHCDDCVQDVFSAVTRSLEQFQPTGANGAFRSWLWTITINKIRDAARRDARHPAATGGSSAALRIENTADPIRADSALVDSDPEESSELEIQDLTRRAVTQIRDEFAKRTWQIFDRSVIDGVCTAQVASEFEITSATVRKVRSRILRRLRQQLGDIA